MDIFRESGNRWFVKVQTGKEKKKLFNIIKKRDRMAIYFHPDGKVEHQFSVTAKECDEINKNWGDGV